MTSAPRLLHKHSFSDTTKTGHEDFCAWNLFDEIPDSSGYVVLDRDMCYCNGIRDKGGGSKIRPLEDCRMRLGEKIAQSVYDDNIGYFIKKKLHVWYQLPSGLWELGMVRGHEVLLLYGVIACYTGHNAIVYHVFLNAKYGWVNWYLVGKFVKKNFYALHLFDEISKRHNMENMSLSSNLEALDIVVLVCRSLPKDLAASLTEENGTLGYINAIKQFLCLSLLHRCALTVMAISQLDYSILTSLLLKLNPELCNRVDVHLDAVFFPKCVANDQIFQQPGWCHTLTNPCDNISSQRVVFNQRNYTIWLMERPCILISFKEDGTTTTSILFFLVYGMHFKEQWKSRTTPYMTVTEQHCVSHHVFSYVIGKRWMLVELELHHKKTGRRIQMLTFGSEEVIVFRPNLRVDGASVYAWLYDYGRICKVSHQLKVILLDNMAHINVLVAAGVISFGCCWCYFFACSSERMSNIFVFAWFLHICLTVSVSWQNELFKFLELDTIEPSYEFKCQLYTLTEVMKDMVEALGLLRSFKSSMHNIGVANDSLKYSDFNDSERIAGFNIQYRLLPSISLFQEFFDNPTLGGPSFTEKNYEMCLHEGKMTEKDITPMGGFPRFGVMKDGYIRSKEWCVGPKKRIVNLRQSLINQTARLAFEDIRLITISKVIILGKGPIALVAAFVENDPLAGSLGVGPFSPFDAAACFLATSMEIEMISWVEIYEEATGNKCSLTKLWGAAITSTGVLSGSSPKVESYMQIVFAVPAASLLLQDS
ncbi:hypothetical protein COP2_010689 [Malus domestica]